MSTRKIIDAFVADQGLSDQGRLARHALAMGLTVAARKFCRDVHGSITKPLKEGQRQALRASDEAEHAEGRLYNSGYSDGLTVALDRIDDVFDQLMRALSGES